ncbi:DNA repair protein RadA [bacterium]|nr:DNA repair protein RadA [bacterium]NBX78555.1 DNA repair protein RadA [bacterium]
MAKQSIFFECNACTYQAPKWQGCCPQCKEWNTLEQQNTVLAQSTRTKNKGATVTNIDGFLHPLDAITNQEKARYETKLEEWDRVLGGGIVPGSFTILTGDPGIGKSTILLQVCAHLSQQYQIIYFSSEESLHQVKLRCSRLHINTQNILFADKADLETIIAVGKDKKPALLIIDSIQNVYSNENFNLPGTINQLKEAAFFLMKLAKENNIAIICTGHITKDGNMAGPKVLEHMVDTVLYLQKEDQFDTRILRSVKNRFGSINEIGFFKMQEKGLEQIHNINEHLLMEQQNVPGSILISTLEGTRPVFLELQGLVVSAQFGVPQRVVTGIDHKQVVLIAAILEKYLHIKMSAHDIFFKVSGGIKIKNNTADAGIALALLSSYFQKSLPPKTIALAEVSLTGQITPTSHIDLHIKEAEKFGFKHIILAASQKVNIKTASKLYYLKNVYEFLPFFPEE